MHAKSCLFPTKSRSVHAKSRSVHAKYCSFGAIFSLVFCERVHKKSLHKKAHTEKLVTQVYMTRGMLVFGGQAWSAKQARGGGGCSLQGPVGRNEKTLIGRINSWLSWDYKYLTNHDKLYFLTILLKTNLREKTIFACMIMFQ